MNRLYVFLYILIILSCNKDKNDSVFIDENENFDINYSVDLNPTGDFSLIIIKDSIEFLDNGDQIGIFDNNGVIESCFPDTIPPCDSPQYGETLVGSGIWNNSQMEISVILSLDFSSFNGPILNGAVKTNPINLKVWKVQDDQEYNTDIIFEQGDGTFNSILSVISSIELK
tara:strand:- start:64 stop:576 length:513 start_codon:yes stop_codon:yes gene_type:complete